MAKSAITHLRHVAMAVPDFAQAVSFYERLWGLTRVASDGDIVFYAAEGSPEPYIIRLRAAAAKRLDLVAFGAADAAAVDRLASELAAAEVRFVSEPGPLQTPGGGYGFRFFDPDGRVVEVSSDVAPRPYRQLEERESIPVKLSHVVLNTPDLPRLQAFYEQKLGFRLSDWLMNFMCFLRCNPSHHSLALVQGPYPSLHHVSYELRGIDEYMRGSGRLIRAGHTPLWGPGRHGAGDNTFTYFLDPNGNVAEYSTELEQILDEDGWKPQVWTLEPEKADQWGTAGPPTERLFAASHNDPDPGLWTPAPV